MNKNRQPLMLAYIVFLLICVIYYAISVVFKIEFIEWNKIVVAVTISSYFFSLSAIQKYDANILTKEKNHYQKCLSFFEQSKEIRVPDVDFTEIDEVINQLDEKIAQNKKGADKYEREGFFLDVFGYISFFCIICLDIVFNGLKPCQELYTVIAFVFILGLEYKKSLIDDKFEKAIQRADEKVTLALSKLERIKAYGQTENANA